MSSTNDPMASSAHEQHSIKQRQANQPNGQSIRMNLDGAEAEQGQSSESNGQVDQDARMHQDDQEEEEDGIRPKDHKLTKHNLKSIPDADQLAPGIRLPAERLTGEGDLPSLNGVANGSPTMNSRDADSGIGQDRRIADEEVATVPPQLDPRTAEFRPPSPSAASVFSVAVQAPGSPRPEPALGESTSSSSAMRQSGGSNSRPSSIRGSSPPLSASSEAASFSARVIPGINSLNSGLARSSLNQGLTTSSGSQIGGPSLAPSEAGSSSSDSRSISNSNSSSVLNHHHQQNRMEVELDDDERVEVGSSNSRSSSNRELDEEDEDVKLRSAYIERQRMHERELMGGEAGVGGLSNLSSKGGQLSYPFSASLRQEQEDLAFSRGAHGIPSRAGSTTATVGTSSPPQSLSGVSDYGDNDKAVDRESLGRRGSTDTIGSTGGGSFKAPSFVGSNGRRTSQVDQSPVPMDEGL